MHDLKPGSFPFFRTRIVFPGMLFRWIGHPGTLPSLIGINKVVVSGIDSVDEFGSDGVPERFYVSFRSFLSSSLLLFVLFC